MTNWNIKIKGKNWREPFQIDIESEHGTNAVIDSMKQLQREGSHLGNETVIKILKEDR